MGAKNKVVAGDYEGREVSCSQGKLAILIPRSGYEPGQIALDKTNVKQYEVMDEEHKKSAVSAVGRAALGAVLLGPIGLFAGVSARRKGIYLIAIEFNDGNKSLLEIDEKRYKQLVKNMF